MIFNKAIKISIGNVEKLIGGKSGTNDTKEKLLEAPKSCIKKI
jgi:hypothetical protein